MNRPPYRERDIQFKLVESPEHLYPSSYAKAQRLALLPAFGISEDYLREVPDRDIMQLLIHGWRDRLAQLRGYGWARLLDGRQYQWCRNCPPAGFYCTPKSYPCKLFCCPFCWARRKTSALFDRLEKLYFPRPTNLRSTRTNPGMHLIQFEHHLQITQDYHADLLQQHPLETWIYQNRSQEIDQVPHAGWFAISTVEVSAGKVDLYRRGVIIPDGVTSYPEEDDEQTKTIEYESFCLSDLARIAARVTRYPPGYLTCDPQWLVWVSKLKQKLSNYGGSLRVSHAKYKPRS